MASDQLQSPDTSDPLPSPCATPEPVLSAFAPTVSSEASTSVPTRLPMEVLLRVVENACATDAFASEHGLDSVGESDSRMKHLKRRYRNIKNYMLVCRDWYATALPLIWDSATFWRNGHLQAFEQVLNNRSTIAPTPAHLRWHRNGCYVRTLDLSSLQTVMFRVPPDSDDEHDSDESEEAVPLNRRAARRRARGVDYGATGAGIDLVGVFGSCPLLERVILGTGTGRITTRSWNELYSSLQHPSLVALRGVTLPHSRPETSSFLDVLNDMPSLSEFSATSMSLQPDLALSLIEIFKMNEKLACHKTGLRLGGLRELSFGGDCELPISFITAIPRACPSLKAFHLLAGANILQANGLLDLDTFASSFPSALEAFTFLGDPGLNTNSSFDRVLESQPSLTYLHIRADFISLDFFLRTGPGVLQILSIDLTSIARSEGVNGSNILPWHLSLSFPSRSSIHHSTSVAREFRRQSLGWTMTTSSGVRTQLLRRLLWLSTKEAEREEEEGSEVEGQRGPGSPVVDCACSDESESDDE